MSGWRCEVHDEWQMVVEIPMKWHEWINQWTNETLNQLTNEPMNGGFEIPMKWHERMNQWNVEPTNPWITSWSAINPTRSQFLLVKFIFSYSFQWFSDVFPLVFGDPKRCRKTLGFDLASYFSQGSQLVVFYAQKLPELCGLVECFLGDGHTTRPGYD